MNQMSINKYLICDTKLDTLDRGVRALLISGLWLLNPRSTVPSPRGPMCLIAALLIDNRVSVHSPLTWFLVFRPRLKCTNTRRVTRNKPIRNSTYRYTRTHENRKVCEMITHTNSGRIGRRENPTSFSRPGTIWSVSDIYNVGIYKYMYVKL